jgi:hypothetical protein
MAIILVVNRGFYKGLPRLPIVDSQEFPLLLDDLRQGTPRFETLARQWRARAFRALVRSDAHVLDIVPMTTNCPRCRQLGFAACLCAGFVAWAVMGPVRDIDQPSPGAVHSIVDGVVSVTGPGSPSLCITDQITDEARSAVWSHEKAQSGSWIGPTGAAPPSPAIVSGQRLMTGPTGPGQRGAAVL